MDVSQRGFIFQASPNAQKRPLAGPASTRGSFDMERSRKQMRLRKLGDDLNVREALVKLVTFHPNDLVLVGPPRSLDGLPILAHRVLRDWAKLEWVKARVLQVNARCDTCLVDYHHGGREEEVPTARIELLTRMDDAAIRDYMHSIEESMDQTALQERRALMLQSLETPRQADWVRPDDRS